MRATLDSNNLVTRVETRSDTPALVTQTDYANYADRAEILTDIKTPGRIVRRQGGRTILDIEVKTWETNNPYLVFPVPPNVKAAAPNPAESRPTRPPCPIGQSRLETHELIEARYRRAPVR